MVLRHELQHAETMRQTMAIAGLLPPGEPPARRAAAGAGRGSASGSSCPRARSRSARRDDGFAYDNERPRHAVELPAFRIARRPVSNASWMRFSEGGGYERREWWSDEGWAWKEEYDMPIIRVAAGHPDAPACHVSWFEADAFARAHDARLPSEREWERAATSEQETAPGGGRAASGSGPPDFLGYPGFRAYPYREYSEVFFGDRYKVLRGGSWATHPRVASDVPQLGPAAAPSDLRRPTVGAREE